MGLVFSLTKTFAQSPACEVPVRVAVCVCRAWDSRAKDDAHPRRRGRTNMLTMMHDESEIRSALCKRFRVLGDE